MVLFSIQLSCSVSLCLCLLSLFFLDISFQGFSRILHTTKVHTGNNQNQGHGRRRLLIRCYAIDSRPHQELCFRAPTPDDYLTMVLRLRGSSSARFRNREPEQPPKLMRTVRARDLDEMMEERGKQENGVYWSSSWSTYQEVYDVGPQGPRTAGINTRHAWLEVCRCVGLVCTAEVWNIGGRDFIMCQPPSNIVLVWGSEVSWPGICAEFCSESRSIEWAAWLTITPSVECTLGEVRCWQSIPEGIIHRDLAWKLFVYEYDMTSAENDWLDSVLHMEKFRSYMENGSSVITCLPSRLFELA
jgi:hypothetical protein